jgi:polyhydroxyalkanoate synthesis repressor PhaR
MKVLKKYANRKIYDSSESCYVTMSDIRNMVKERQTIKIVDSTTGEDITRSILLLILSDQENSSGTVMLTNTVLESLIRMYDDPMGAMLASFLDRGIKDFMGQGETFKKQFDSYVTGSQQDNITRLFEQYANYWKKGSPFTPPDDKS